ncbi:hypothetical protein D623_10006375 [Myotis brandtii]|uniref:Uncharacterized protein n=1 Tax=Myotis brandtii TaxID=109478 RepID=S7MCM8_MYOBR|nr:hypothetical protein D623_10006375 [Myotis brandtii]
MRLVSPPPAPAPGLKGGGAGQVWALPNGGGVSQVWVSCDFKTERLPLQSHFKGREVGGLQPSTERLPLQSHFKGREVGGLQPSNGLNSRRFECEDENPVGEDGIQQMCPLYNQMCYQDRSPGKHHRSNDPERVYINPREHYV